MNLLNRIAARFAPLKQPQSFNERKVMWQGKNFDSMPIIDIVTMVYSRNGFNYTNFIETDNNGDTALTYLIQVWSGEDTNVGKISVDFFRNFKDQFSYLLNIPNHFGETPLHCAAISNNVKMAELLVKQNVDGSLKDGRNLTALDIALMMEHTQLATILKSLETSILSDVESSIYNWGEIFTSRCMLESISTPKKILFNDELCAPISIQYGQSFSLILTDTGSVYSSGLSSYGKTGHDKKRDILIPTLIKEFESSNKRIKYIECGAHHSLALDDLGQVYSWGNGSLGRLGLDIKKMGELKYVSKPTLIDKLVELCDPVISISAGLDNSFVITATGKVYSFGSATHEKLGYEELILHYQETPRLVSSIPPMQQVSCSNWHTVLLDRDGVVYTFGSPLGGRLGRKSNGPRKDHRPTPLLHLTEKIKKIKCGSNFSNALSVYGNLYSWGVNKVGQLGCDTMSLISTETLDVPTLVKCLDKSIAVHDFAVGQQHVVVLTDQGQVYCYGDNQKNQCSTGVLSGRFQSISFTQVILPYVNGSTVFKVSAGGNSTMISLSSEHHIFGEELLKSLNIGVAGGGIGNNCLFSDVKLTINQNFDGQFLNAHKIVLAARSKKLDSLIRKQLNNPYASQSIPFEENVTGEYNDHKVITSQFINGQLVIDFPVSTIQILVSFLKYIYSDHTNLVNLPQPFIQELGKLAYAMGSNRLSYLCNFIETKSLDKLPTSTLLEDFQILKQSEFSDIYSDVTFKCISSDTSIDEEGAGDGNGLIQSYRLFAYIGSTYFKTMLGGSYIESEKKQIELFETSIQGISALLNYFYCEEIPEDVNQCIEMIIISDIHSTPRAKEAAAAKIRNQIDNDSLCYIYHLSLIYNVKALTIWCLSKLSTISNIRNLPYFKELPIEVQNDLISLNKKK